MVLYNLLFYVFASALLLSSIGVISAKNTVYSVLLLIFAFFNTAAIFVLLGAEFLAMSLVIVYVGAVAVLFLFVVMTLNIKLIEIKKYTVKNFKLLLTISIVLFAEIVGIIYFSVTSKYGVTVAQNPFIHDGITTNAYQIGMLMYTNYGYVFQVCGAILFVAIVGAIILTQSKGRSVRRQSVNLQVARSKSDSVKLVSVKIGGGVDAISK